MRGEETNGGDPQVLALRALGWTLSEPDRAERLLALTGLTPDTLRASAGDPQVLEAVLAFLEAHEPDLIACAEEIGTTPAGLVDARRRLEG